MKISFFIFSFLVLLMVPVLAEQEVTSHLDAAMDVSLSGLLAQKLHLELIASNIANMNVTRSPEGGPYIRQVAIFTSDYDRGSLRPKGVKLASISRDPTPGKRIYNPGHPDADADGYVTMPNVELSNEMMDMIYATRLYEANITVFNAAKQLANTTMELGR